jgi:CBS domain-containing membrane protein
MAIEERPATLSRRSSGWRRFSPILAGATARDRALACLGAFVGVTLVGLGTALLHGDGPQAPWVVAPIGASAVLVFAVPASPMAQPWPVVGGNVLSALVGVVVVHVVDQRTLAISIAVGLAIAVMSLTRCLHPPGGAMALAVALGGSGVTSSTTLFPLAPVAVDAVAIVIAGWAFHLVSGHAYPHTRALDAVRRPTSDPAPTERVGFRAEDIDAVLANLGETFDISREDLGLLLHEVEARALTREHGDLTSGEIMSRDVLSVDRKCDPETARQLLLESGVRLLPVTTAGGRVVGGVGLRELARTGTLVEDLMVAPLTTTADQPAITLTRALTDGHRHAAMVVDEHQRLIGLVTQADLLAALARRSHHG